MEQRRLLKFLNLDIQNSKLSIQIAILVIQIGFLVTQTGCKQPIDNPELADPVYLDLISEMNAAKNQIASELKSVAETREKIATLPPRDPTRSALLRELSMRERNLMLARQNRTYFEVRAEQRKKFDAEAYKKAFDADLPWPNMEEVSEYRKVKKLKTASRNWEDRVPKTTRYNRIPADSESKEAPKAEKSGGATSH